MSTGVPPPNENPANLLHDCNDWLPVLCALIIELELEKDPLRKTADFSFFAYFVGSLAPSADAIDNTCEQGMRCVAESVARIGRLLVDFSRFLQQQPTPTRGDLNERFMDDHRQLLTAYLVLQS